MRSRIIPPHKVTIVAGLVTILLLCSLGLVTHLGAVSSQASQQILTAKGDPGKLHDRTIRIHDLKVTSARTRGLGQAAMTVVLTNTGTGMLSVEPGDFLLSAEGDLFGQVSAPTPSNALSGTLAPGVSNSGRLTFLVPLATLQVTNLFYRAGRESAGISASIPLASASTGSNVIEDNFTRANQTGWGITTNNDGVPAVSWGMDGNGSKSFVTINNNAGVYGYPGGTNQVGIASSGATAYNGGDSLVAFWMSAVGHVTPYVVQNACADKSCYYGLRLHTSQNKLELAKRVGNSTMVIAMLTFTPSANTRYWMRLDVSVGRGKVTLRGKIWADGSAEPGWMVTATDNTPLAANLVGTGGSWDMTGTRESINYACYAFAVSTLASACSASLPPQPTPTPTTPTPTPTPTQGTITEYPLNTGGVGEPWGTAVDTQGNVWFAEPGCDFAPSCSSSTPPGELGEWVASTHQTLFYTLPNITGNQPIFVVIDGSGNIWFTTPNNSMIGEFSPASQSFVGQWAVTSGSGPWDLAFNKGQIWFTEHFVSSIGSFNPVTHTYTDYPTPSANTNPYGIAANDPVNGNLIWFTENNGNVARIAVLDIGNNNTISEYPIRAEVNVGVTPHLLALDAQGHPWWSEGWVRAIGTLDPTVATSGTCGTSTGDCIGVQEHSLPAPPASCSSSHVSGMVIQSSGIIWTDDSLSAQIGSFNPATQQFTMYNLVNCGAHPHDGLNIDAAPHIWWDEEFANALGELYP